MSPKQFPVECDGYVKYEEAEVIFNYFENKEPRRGGGARNHVEYSKQSSSARAA